MANKSKKRLSKISLLHYYKLFGRSFLFLMAIVFYVIDKVHGHSGVLGGLEKNIPFLVIVWVCFTVEMLLRFFPSNVESMGCQKQFRRNFIKTELSKPNLPSTKGTLITLLSWLLLNGAIATLYFTGLIDEGVLILISLLYSVCDMICILFFCPFQTWFMKNKCCGSCRIYNWDYAMMFTPLALIIHPFTLSLFGMGILLLIVWEIALRIHPERFAENTNASLTCKNCKEKLCHHKSQLRGFIKKHKELIAQYTRERENKRK